MPLLIGLLWMGTFQKSYTLESLMKRNIEINESHLTEVREVYLEKIIRNKGVKQTDRITDRNFINNLLVQMKPVTVKEIKTPNSEDWGDYYIIYIITENGHKEETEVASMYYITEQYVLIPTIGDYKIIDDYHLYASLKKLDHHNELKWKNL